MRHDRQRDVWFIIYCFLFFGVQHWIIRSLVRSSEVRLFVWMGFIMCNYLLVCLCWCVFFLFTEIPLQHKCRNVAGPRGRQFIVDSNKLIREAQRKKKLKIISNNCMRRTMYFRMSLEWLELFSLLLLWVHMVVMPVSDANFVCCMSDVSVCVSCRHCSIGIG